MLSLIGPDKIATRHFAHLQFLQAALVDMRNQVEEFLRTRDGMLEQLKSVERD